LQTGFGSLDWFIFYMWHLHCMTNLLSRVSCLLAIFNPIVNPKHKLWDGSCLKLWVHISFDFLVKAINFCFKFFLVNELYKLHCWFFLESLLIDVNGRILNCGIGFLLLPLVLWSMNTIWIRRVLVSDIHRCRVVSCTVGFFLSHC
jgi:hypothetical protein